MTTEEIRKAVVSVVCEHMGKESVLGSDKLDDDLGADSLDCVEIVIGIEEALKVDVNEEAMHGNVTVNDLVGVVVKIMEAKNANQG